MESIYNETGLVAYPLQLIWVRGWIEGEFHYFADDIGVAEDNLHAGWFEHMLKLKFPLMTDNEINRLISDIGWH